jgi:hypothetical protein
MTSAPGMGVSASTLRLHCAILAGRATLPSEVWLAAEHHQHHHRVPQPPRAGAKAGSLHQLQALGVWSGRKSATQGHLTRWGVVLAPRRSTVCPPTPCSTAHQDTGAHSTHAQQRASCTAQRELHSTAAPLWALHKRGPSLAFGRTCRPITVAGFPWRRDPGPSTPRIVPPVRSLAPAAQRAPEPGSRNVPALMRGLASTEERWLAFSPQRPEVLSQDTVRRSNA